jgi:hypothetical protein
MSRFVSLERRCWLWPNCACRSHLVNFNKLLDDDERIWEPEELSTAETILYFTLECVSNYCPDTRIRKAAEIELMKPWWENQRPWPVPGFVDTILS